jgi:signal transduction histidine kinase
MASSRSIKSRLLLISGLWLALSLLASGLVLANLFRTHAEEGFDTELAGQVDELAALADLDAKGQAVVPHPPADPRYGRAYSGWYWLLIQDGREAARSRSLWDGELTLPNPLPPTPFAMTGPKGEKLRGVARKLTLAENAKPVTFLIAGPQARIDQATWDFTGHLALSLLFLGLGLIAAILLQVGWGLQPLKRLGQALTDIRAGNAKRIDGVFPSEISELTNEVNELIEHNTKLIERARTHAGNLAHALKTPLAALMNEADRMDGAKGVQLKILTQEMTTSIDHHLRRARIAASKGRLGSRTDLAATASKLIQTLGKLNAGRRLQASLEGIRGPCFLGERQDLEEMLGVLIENAFAWARERVRVTLCEARQDWLAVLIEDDGPGIPEERRQEVLKRGQRLDETVPGSGLGLSIALDLAEAYGGNLTLDVSELGGLLVRLELPKAS